MSAVSRNYRGLTAAGTFPAVGAPGSTPFSNYSIQSKGVGAAPTSWTAVLEGSLDGANWTAVITHNANDGSTQFAVDKPCRFVRLNLSALSLGSATAVDVYIAASSGV